MTVEIIAKKDFVIVAYGMKMNMEHFFGISLRSISLVRSEERRVGKEC